MTEPVFPDSLLFRSTLVQRRRVDLLVIQQVQQYRTMGRRFSHYGGRSVELVTEATWHRVGEPVQEATEQELSG